MIGPRILRDAKFGAQEGAADFGNEFLGRIGGIAKALTECASQALVRPAPVGLMPISA